MATYDNSLRLRAAPFSERVVVVIERSRARMRDRLLGAQHLEQRLENAERQANVVRDPPALTRAEHRQVLADQGLDIFLTEPRLFAPVLAAFARAIHTA